MSISDSNVMRTVPMVTGRKRSQREWVSSCVSPEFDMLAKVTVVVVLTRMAACRKSCIRPSTHRLAGTTDLAITALERRLRRSTVSAVVVAVLAWILAVHLLVLVWQSMVG
jgi:hypothetical protein